MPSNQGMSRFLPVLFACVAAPVFGASPDPLDRQRLVAHFEMTDSWLADEVSHLTPAQSAFRPSPTSWSVLDCVEHLVLSEREYWATLKTSMAARPIKGESPSEDIDRLWYGIDRTRRDKTTESETPKSRYASIGAALKDFQALRATMLTYARTSQEDWRHHLIPEWDRDAYQWLLMISAHSQRHILQIREIKHNPAFPGM
jgi:DinB superfamily